MNDDGPASTERIATRTGETIQLDRCVLLVLDGSDAGLKVPLEAEQVLIGSADVCAAALRGRGISKRHAEIVREKGRLLLRDLGSTNGTFLNGARIREAFLGPGDVLTLGDVRLRLETSVERLKVQPSSRDRFGPLYGTSAPMRQLFGVLEKVAPTEASVLVQAESGSGKDLVARALHQASRRASGPFVVVDASAQSAELMASELFGHVEGAFTGANRRHPGAFVAAEGGTVFLDEIGELPLDLQPKFLRALENREVRPVGSSHPVPVDVRIVAATNRDLGSMVERGAFREDLYYRLAVVQVWIPPLRERPEDLPGLIETLTRGLKGVDPAVRLTEEAIEILSAQPWRGNVRELRNVLERTFTLAPSPVIEPRDLMLTERTPGGPARPVEKPGDSASIDSLMGRTLEDIEREVVRRTFEATGGNQTETARRLGMSRNGLAKMLKRYGIAASADPES